MQTVACAHPPQSSGALLRFFFGEDKCISFMTWFILFAITFKFRMTRSSLSPHCLFAASRRYVNNFGPCFEMHTQVPSACFRKTIKISDSELKDALWIKLDNFLSTLTSTAITFLQKFIDAFIGTLCITANIKYFHRIAFIVYMIYTVSARLQSYEQINFEPLKCQVL